jgi:hypothetical protein
MIVEFKVDKTIKLGGCEKVELNLNATKKSKFKIYTGGGRV